MAAAAIARTRANCIVGLCGLDAPKDDKDKDILGGRAGSIVIHTQLGLPEARRERLRRLRYER